MVSRFVVLILVYCSSMSKYVITYFHKNVSDFALILANGRNPRLPSACSSRVLQINSLIKRKLLARHTQVKLLKKYQMNLLNDLIFSKEPRNPNRNPRKRCEICSKVTIKTERCRSGVFIVNFKYILQFFSVSVVDFEQLNVC